MLNFNRLVPNRVYRVKDKFTLPYDLKNPTKGTLLTVLSEDVEHTAQFFTNPFLDPLTRRYKRYYLERKLKENLAGLQVREINKRDSFLEGFGKYHPDVKYFYNPEMIHDYNVVYEIGQFNEVLNDNKRIEIKAIMAKAQIKFNEVMTRLKKVDSDFPNHKKFLFIPVDRYVSNPKETTLWTKRDHLNNFGMSFIRHIDTDYNRFRKDLKNWTLVFINRNEMFYLNCKDLSDDTPKILRSLFRRFKSSVTFIDTTNVDDINLGNDEKDNDQTFITNNTDKVETSVKNLEREIRSSGFSKDVEDKLITDMNSDAKKALLDTRISGKKSELQTSSSTPKSTPKKNDTLATSRITKRDTDDSTPQPSVKDVDTSELENKVKQEVKRQLADGTAAQSASRIARTAKIREDMKNIRINDETDISDLKRKAEMKKIEPKKIDSSVINPRLHEIKFNNFEKGYNENLMDYDTMNILTSFAEKDRPLYLISFNKEDTSTAIDKVYTYTCVFEDEFGRRHHLTFDLPKFNNDKFMFLNGSDKIFINQIIPLPVSKVSPNQVQMSSMYNKIFITRFGKNVSTKISKFFKLYGTIPASIMVCDKGNNLESNTEYMTSMEYDELSTKFTTITLKNTNITVYFNQNDIRRICESEGLMFDSDTELPFAIQIDSKEKKTLICMDSTSGDIKCGEEGVSPIDYIVKNMDDSTMAKEFAKMTGSKKSIYTRAKIMAKDVPVILLLSFLEGLEPILNKLKCNYSFSETRTREDSNKRGVIKFKDGYLSYDLYPYNNSLLLNGFYDIPTEEYNFLDFSSKDIYYEIFMKLFGRRNIGNAFENFKQLFMDPITLEVLQDHNLPTDFIDLVIYANSLLENNVFDKDGDLRNYRVRSNEMVNDHLYKVLAKAYENYRLTADNKNPSKFSIRQNEVINSMFDSQVMEEYSNLNPIFEIDRMRATSYKGPGGCNVDKGFKIAKRAYNETMLGVIAQSSPISANVGISRILSIDPNITSLRGYIDVGSVEDMDKLNSVNMLSGAEMLVPMTATHDDPQRVGMASTQSRHTLATMESDVPLFGYGMDKILAKMISDKFAFKAKENGYILEHNPELGYIIVKYESGKTEVIDLTDRQSLNTGSGFYINNRLEPIHTEVGTKFNAGDVLAANGQFFEYDALTRDVIYKSGPLARVALIHGSFVYEDSTLVTQKFANKMASYVNEVKEIRIGKNSNIYSICKIGDNIHVNDPFIVFDESYEDDYLNKMLEKMNDDDRQELIESSRSQVKSKWNGEIVDIKIYYTCPKSEMSPTLRKVIEKYEEKIRARRKNFEAAGVNIKDMTTLNENDAITVPVNGKIAGTKMEDFHVLIKFFVRTIDSFSVGDKLTFGTALKGINQGLIPLGKEPYLLSDPDIKIDAFLSIAGLYARMTNSASISLALNAVMIGAEKKIKDILES